MDENIGKIILKIFLILSKLYDFVCLIKSFSSQNSLSQTLHGKYFRFFYLSKLPKGLKNDSLLKDLLKNTW